MKIHASQKKNVAVEIMKRALKEYVDQMKEGQNEIYYACGETADRIAMLPQVASVEGHGYEVPYLTDDIDEFAERFVVDEELLGSLRAAAEKDSITPAGGEEEYQRSLPMLSLQLKALLARDIWNTSEYMQIFNSEDENFKKALELVQTRDMNAVLRKEKKK